MFNRFSLIFLIVAISSTNCVKLENICHVFKYNGIVVNSIHRIELNTTYDKITTYLIDDAIDFRNMFSKKEYARQMDSLRNSYNGFFDAVYSENYFKFYELMEFVEDDIETVKSKMLTKVIGLKKFVNVDKIDEFQRMTIDRIRKGLEFMEMIKYLLYNKFYINDKKNLEKLKDFILNLEIETNQRFVFENRSPKSIYKDEKILFLRKFILNKRNMDYPKVPGILMTDIVLPFFNQNYEKTDDCVPTYRLPLFYNRP